MPFVQVGTHPTRNFALFVTLLAEEAVISATFCMLPCRSDYIFRVNEFSSRVGKPLRSSMLQSYPDTSGGVGVDNLRARIQKVFHHIEFMVSFTCLACSL